MQSEGWAGYSVQKRSFYVSEVKYKRDLMLTCDGMPLLASGQDAKEFNQVAKETVEPKRIWQRNTGRVMIL